MKNMLWLDMEMSGLNPVTDVILETAVIITDKKFNVLDTYDKVIFQSTEVIDKMDDWCKKHHGESGLIAKIPTGISTELLDQELSALVHKHFKVKKDKIILCGNSIAQDRKFIDKYLPEFSALLHYRMLDVSSWKIVFEDFYKKKFEKKKNHRALDDVQESIDELKYYLQFIKDV